MTDQEQPQQTLEERFVSLREAARSIDCELQVSLTVGGVRLEEVYKIYETDDPDVSLSESLDKIDEMIGDVRVNALAQATNRLVSAENIAKMFDLVLKNRNNEYRIAHDAMKQAFQHKNRPEDGDLVQSVLGEIAVMDRDAPIPDDLAEIIAEAYGRLPQAQPNKRQPEHPDSGA